MTTKYVSLTLTEEEAELLDVLLNPYDAGDQAELLTVFDTLSRSQPQIDVMSSVVNKLRAQVGEPSGGG